MPTQRQRDKNMRGTAALGMASGAGAVLANTALVPAVMGGKNSLESKQNKEVKKLVKSMGLKKHYKIHHYSDFHGYGPAFVPRTSVKALKKQLGKDVKARVYVGKRGAGVAAHELGHARVNLMYERLLGKKLAPTAEKAFMRYRTVGRLASSPMNALLVAAPQSDRNKKIVGYGLSGAMIPVLASEGAATAIGTKHMIKNFGLKRGLKSLGRTGPAFLTYLTAGMAPALTAALATNETIKKKLGMKDVPNKNYKRK